MDPEELNPRRRAELTSEMRQAFEHAEVAYLKARAAGIADPVLIIKEGRPDESRDGAVPCSVSYDERSQAIERFEDQPEVVEMLRTPTPGYEMTVLYFGQGLTIHECVPPE